MKNFILQIGRYGTLGVMAVGGVIFTHRSEMHAYDYFSLTCAMITLIYQILDHHKLNELLKREP